MMNGDNNKVCPICGGEMVGATCPYCHYVDSEFKANAEETMRIGRKVIDEHFDVAYPEYFDKDFDLLQERTTYRFKYKYVLEIENQKILIEASLTNSIMQNQKNRHASPISLTTVNHTIPSMVFLVGNTKFVCRGSRPIAFKEWSMFCVGDISMLQFSNNQLRNAKATESAIKGLQMFTKAFYEAVIGDGSYSEELDALIGYNRDNSNLIQSQDSILDKELKAQERALAEKERREKEGKEKRLWDNISSRRSNIRGSIGWAYFYIILSCILLFAPLIYWIYNFGYIDDILIVGGICGGIAFFAILLLLCSFVYLIRGLKRKRDFKREYPTLKDKGNSHFGIWLLIFILIIAISSCGYALHSNIHYRLREERWQKEMKIRQENDSIVANLIKREFVYRFKGKTFSNESYYYKDKLPINKIKILDSENLLFKGYKCPYSLNIKRERYSGNKYCTLSFLNYESENIIDVINVKVGDDGYTFTDEDAIIIFKPAITFKQDFNTITLSPQ